MTTKDERLATMRAEVRARRRDQRAPSAPPGSWAARAACRPQSELFSDPKQSVEALAICATCPVRNECYEWALHNAVDGVAGGMTAAARSAWRKVNKVAEPTVSIDDFLPPEVVAADSGSWLARNDAVLKAVAEWTTSGESARAIGARLGVSRRSVDRYRNLCRQRAFIA